MIRPRNSRGHDRSTSQYNNIVTTQSDQSAYKDQPSQIGKQLVFLAKNFDILQQFLQGLKSVDCEKQIAELACTVNFKQQWQNKRKQQNQLKYSYFFRQNSFYLIFSIFLLLTEFLLIWFLSVFRVFGYKNNEAVFLLSLFIQILDVSLKSTYLLFYKLKKQNAVQFNIKSKDWLQIYSGNIYCIFYSILGISQVISSTQIHSLIIFDIIAIGFSYFRIEDIQNDIKMIKSTSDFKNYIKLFNLMRTLIMIIHFFAVLMYFSTNFTSTNYLDQLIAEKYQSWIDLYIYSFYFSGSTVLTVGYGDILPKNIIQIFIVLLMQIFGVVMIVYLNGQVGNILCSLRREKQNLQNDLSVLQRLKHNFKLSFQTTQKIRQYLIDNRRADQQSNVSQEKALLSKISSDLRQQATLTNNVNIIKKSVFLLTNFTAKAQIFISNKLIQHIYSPNQKIPQIMGKQKLFFIKRGQISLYISKKEDENQNFRKIVKNLLITKQNKSSDCNCFGYVSLIMGRPNRIKMFSKDFSNCYYIQKSSFLEAVNCDSKDYEKYYQMRQNFLSQRQPQKNQVELFHNQSEHYVCEISKVIERYLKDKDHSKRRNILRKLKKRKLILQVNNQDRNIDESQSEKESVNSSKVKIGTTEIKSNLNSCLTFNERKQKYKEFNNEQLKNSAKNLVVQRKYVQRYCTKAYKKKVEQKMKQQNNTVRQEVRNRIDQPFEAAMNFSYFFTEFNIDMVMRKVNYYTKVLSIFTNMFQQTLQRAKRQADQSGEVVVGSSKKIQNYRRQKDFLETINLKL